MKTPCIAPMKVPLLARLLLLLYAFACLPARGEQDNSDSWTDESLVIAPNLSNNNVTSFAEDAEGYIWIGTDRGLNKYNGLMYHQYFSAEDTTTISHNQIRSLLCDSKGRLWIGTFNGVCVYTDRDNFHRIPIDLPGSMNHDISQILESRDGRIFLNMEEQLCVYNPERDQFDCVIDPFDPEHTQNVYCHVDIENNLWVVNPHGLRRYDASTLELKDSVPTPFYADGIAVNNQEIWLSSGQRQLTLYDLRTRKYVQPPQPISNHPFLNEFKIDNIHSYQNNNLLISTAKGLFLFNQTTQTVLYQNDEGFPFEAPSFWVSTQFTDSQGNLWLGSWIGQGVFMISNQKSRFNVDYQLAMFTKDKTAVCVTLDRENHLWFSVPNKGIFTYDLDNKTINKITCDNRLSQLEQGSVFFIFEDKDGYLWFSTYPTIVARCRYQNDHLICENIYSSFEGLPRTITQDKEGTIWVGSQLGNIYALRAGDQQFTPIPLFPQRYNLTSGLLPLSTDEILVSTFGQPLLLIQPSSRAIRELEIQDQEMKDFVHSVDFLPSCAYEDSRGNIWIGTMSNGLFRYDPSSQDLRSLPGTSCKDIVSIEEDRQGQIWISTLYGLSKYDYTTDSFTNYYVDNGIGGNQFYGHASCRLPDGTLAFGGTHGLTLFDPMDVGIKRDIPLVFEDLRIHNRLIRPGKDHNIDKSLAFNPDIHLRHDEDGFSISFAALDYEDNDPMNYAYKMEGLDKFWVDAKSNREAYYAKLPAGKYTFKVRISSNDNSIMEKENAIRVIVHPAPWLTWWAWSLYCLLAAAIIYSVFHVWHRIQQEKNAVLLAQQEKEQERRVNRMNMSFFANISHEFRTPLTMISGPITQLCESPRIEREDKQLLHVVSRNVSRMLRLVNQLLDFNKLENDTLKLRVSRTDIIAMLRRMADVYQVSANEKGISLHAHGLEDSFLMWLDADKLDKIMANLFSNALKFTPAGGRIDLYFDTDGQNAKIVVADTGSGIPEGQLENVFKRYYQLDNQDKGNYNWGTGIGLYFARSLAQLHHGSLTAGNQEEGTGAVFTLLLPLGDAAYSDEERSLPDERQDKAFPLSTESYQPVDTQDNQQEKKTILVVDDDTEVVHYLKILLSPHYRVVYRFSADEAFKAMTEEAPDLVLSDVIMPKKSGYELCRQIKDDLQLCHIPVILVTAKVTVESQVEGLNTGADAYVTKPFEPNYLLALIKSQLKNREKVRDLLNRSTQTDKIEENVLSPQDNAFMSDLYKLMESELSNPELDVARMTERLRISRTKFYYKVKGLTGENPGAFFKTYKLNRAAELIRSGKYNISEVADMTGFNTLSHFSTSFKKQFGKTPTDYGKH